MNDEVAPQSAASALPAAVSTTALSVAYTASDDQVGVAAVELWQRYRATPTGAWSAYAFITSATTSPISVTLGLGDGEYEFYTIAQDRNGNRETAPPSADARTTLDRTSPASSVSALPAQTSSSPASVPDTASDDRSGVASAELWYRFRVLATDPWGAWVLGPTAAASPFSFSLPSGSGFYEFYSIAIDAAGNRELAPTVADASTQKTASSSWPASTRVNDDTGTTQQDRPAIAFGPDGAAYLIWGHPGCADVLAVRLPGRDPDPGRGPQYCRAALRQGLGPISTAVLASNTR